MNRTMTITKRQGAVLDRSAVHRWLDNQLDLMPNGGARAGVQETGEAEEQRPEQAAMALADMYS